MAFKRMVKALAAEIGLGRVDTVVIHDRPTQDMQGRLAVITGGTSGIGLEIGKRFCASGCRVALLGTNAEKGGRAVDEITETYPMSDARYFFCDVSNPDSARTAIEEVSNAFSGEAVGILVNSAGKNCTERFPEVTPQVFDEVMAVNLKGVLFMSQIVARKMIDQNTKGNILNISSMSSYRPAPSPYEVSKWGLRGLTIGMADELIKHGIVVNSIAPGPTATPMLGLERGADLKLGWNPSGRMADAREIAELAAMLVSDVGRLIVGDTVCAGGGGGVLSLQR